MNDVIFQLNEELHLSNKGHILYLFESKPSYFENVCTYIFTAIDLNQTIVLIEKPEHWRHIQTMLKRQLSKQDFQHLHYVDANLFYMDHEMASCNTIVSHFESIISSLKPLNRQIRTWAHIECKNNSTSLMKQLKEFEKSADLKVEGLDTLSVCAYDANDIPASLMLGLKRTHGYIMTDHEFFASTLYAKAHDKVIFPSLSEQERMKSEMDLYKQKLDFVHVISHEVRNPLTVIKAYCSIMLQEPENLLNDTTTKLHEIKDYVDIIDHELTHIIHTEQMLSNEQLWQKSWIHPFPVIQEVVDFMLIKAKSQSQQLIVDVTLTEDDQLYANKVGLKLILSNLLSNAIKYNQEDKNVIFTCKRKKDELFFVIEDFGVGMEQDQLEKLFIKYNKLNHDKGGQGIGLYMVKKLIDDFHGAIHFKSEIGIGTKVTVHLPLNDQFSNHIQHLKSTFTTFS